VVPLAAWTPDSVNFVCPQDGLVRLRVDTPDAWLDACGELAAPFFTAVFDLGIDALKQAVGLDEAYRLAARRSTVALEAHLRILAAVPRGSTLEVLSRIVDCDAKRLHVAQTLQREATTVATRESMTISFDLDARRSCAFADGLRQRIEALHVAQRTLPPHVGSAERLGIGRALPDTR